VRDIIRKILKEHTEIVIPNNKKKYVLSLQEDKINNTFTGDGSTTTFSLAYSFIDSSFSTINLPDPTNIDEIEVFKASSGTTALTANVHYTYNTSTGVVTISPAPVADDTITIHLRDFVGGFKTLTFDEDINGWSSFYSYKPAFGGSIDADFYTFGINDLYKHYDLDANRGSFYGAATSNSTVNIIFNNPPSISKYFKTINYEGDTGWSVNSIETDTDTGATIKAYVTTSAAVENTWQDLLISGFKKKNNKYYSNIINETAPKRNEIASGEVISGVKGFFNKIQLKISDTAQKELFAVSSDYELLTN